MLTIIGLDTIHTVSNTCIYVYDYRKHTALKPTRLYN